MAQNFQLNGTTLTYITEADWQPDPASQALDGNTPTERWARHIWRGGVMPMSEFDVIYALGGQKVAIVTTSYEDRNGDYLAYFGCDLESVRGRHEGLNVFDVVCEFLVRL